VQNGSQPAMLSTVGLLYLIKGLLFFQRPGACVQLVIMFSPSSTNDCAKLSGRTSGYHLAQIIVSNRQTPQRARLDPALAFETILQEPHVNSRVEILLEFQPGV